MISSQSMPGNLYIGPAHASAFPQFQTLLNMSEPVDWEKRWQEGNTQWDHGESSPALKTLIKEHSDLLPTKGRGLVPGCGSGKK